MNVFCFVCGRSLPHGAQPVMTISPCRCVIDQIETLKAQLLVTEGELFLKSVQLEAAEAKIKFERAEYEHDRRIMGDAVRFAERDLNDRYWGGQP